MFSHIIYKYPIVDKTNKIVYNNNYSKVNNINKVCSYSYIIYGVDRPLIMLYNNNYSN